MEAHEEAMRVRFRETSDAFMATSREAEQLATVASRTLVSSVGQMTALLDRHEEMIVTLRNEVKRSNWRVLVVVGVGWLLTMATILVAK